MGVAGVPEQFEDPIFDHLPQERVPGKYRTIMVGSHRHAWCPSCSQYKTLPEFHQNASRRYGIGPFCRVCYLADNRRRKYGASPEDVDNLWMTQDGNCAICESDLELSKAHVDHDHTTGKIRGLLCGHCNPAIGFLKDNPTFCRAAADYLERG